MSDQVIPYNYNLDPLNQGPSENWQWSPYANAPGGVLGQQVLGMAGGYIAGQHGMIPMGMGYQGNLHNNMRQQMFSSAHMSAMQEASKSDMKIMIDMERGMLAAAGVRVGAAEEQALAQLNSHVVKAAPYVNPQLMDILTGGRSATNLAHSIHLGGLGRRDAVTGNMNMSGDTSAHISKDIFNSYFADPDYGSKTAGLTSLQMGQMFGELNRRGMMPGFKSDRERVVDSLFALKATNTNIDGMLQNAGVDVARFGNNKESLMNGLSDTQVDKLASNTEVQRGMRTVDSTRVRETLDKYKGAISAVQEIFGDNGKPNAPMRELMNALESLTQGGLQQLNPGRTEMMVRNIYNASKAANVDMQTVTGMMQAAGAQTDAMKLNPIFASQMTESGLMFGAAYNMSGIGELSTWGLQNQKQAIGTHMAAYGRGINSDAANRIATIMRLQERLGAAKGGKTKEMIDAVNNGAYDPRWALMGRSEFEEMVAKDMGLSRQDISTALDAKDTNQEFIHKNNIGGLMTRYAQPYEFMQKIARPQFEAEAYSMLKKTMGKGDHRKFATSLTDMYMSTLKAMPNAVLADSQARNKSAVTTMLSQLQEAAKANPNGPEAKFLAQAGPDVEKTLTMFAENAFSSTDQTYRDRHGGEGFLNHLLRTSSDVGNAHKQVSAEVNLQSALQKRAAGVLGGGSPLFNFMRDIAAQSKSPEEADVRKSIGKALGTVGKEHLAGQLASDIIALTAEEAELKRLQTDGVRKAAGNPELERQINDDVEKKTKAIKTSRERIQTFMDNNGLTDVLGSIVDAEQAGGEGGGSTNTNFNITNLTINAKDGTLVLKDAKGGGPAKSGGKGGGTV